LNQILHEKRSGTNGRKSSLFLFFLDIKKAYDRVWRNGLWISLINKGIAGQMLLVLQSIYSRVSAKVKTHAGSSEAFDILIGVKQGCVLSPILFNIFLNSFIVALSKPMKNGKEESIEVAGHPISNLFFADDGLCFAKSRATMKKIVTAADEWLHKWRLEVGHAKCGIMIMGDVPAAKQEDFFEIQGQPLPFVDEYKYLGCILHRKKLWKLEVKRRLVLMEERTKVLASILRAQKIRPKIKLELWQAVVRSAVFYGSEVWQLSKTQTTVVDRKIRQALRWMGNLRTSSTNEALYLEFGTLNCQNFMLFKQLSFFGRNFFGNKTKFIFGLIRSIYRRDLSCPEAVAEANIFLKEKGNLDLPYDDDEGSSEKREWFKSLEDQICLKQSADMKLSSQSKPTMDFLWTLKNSFKRKPTSYWLDKSLSIKQQRLLFNARTRSLPLFSRTFFWRGSSARMSNFAQHLDIQNPKCLLCQNEEEAYEGHEHFFFNCPALSPIRFGFLQALLSLFCNVPLQEFTQVKMSADSKSLIFPESLPATACLKTLPSACLNFHILKSIWKKKIENFSFFLLFILSKLFLIKLFYFEINFEFKTKKNTFFLIFLVIFHIY
jgi:hypothetical protein